MKSQDQLLLEAAYSEVSSKVKELYSQIMPLAEKILDLDSLTDDELVSKYREEFDKQFEGSEDSNSHLLKQLYQIALKRGGNVKKKIQSYAISKSELER